MISGRGLVTLVREAVRAAATPFRLVQYLFTRRRWEARIQAALTTPLPALQDPDTALPHPESEPHIFISAGEASGEGHALGLISAIHNQGLRPRWSCFGSEAMADAGGRLVYPQSELALMGILPVLRRLPELCSAYDRYHRLLQEDPPDLVVLVDYPGLHMVLAEAAKQRGIPVLHYIAPQYWAWAPWRMGRYKRCIDRTLTILPFEGSFFDEVGIPCTYVGHPLLDEVEQNAPAADELQELRENPTLCLLPGSRTKEIRLNLPGMVAVARKLRKEFSDLCVVLPHRDGRQADLVREILRTGEADFVDVHVGSPAQCLAGARVVLAKSGTGSLEACLHGTPTVVVYKVRGRLTMFVYTRIVSVPFFSSANLIAGREIVPEFAFGVESHWDQVADAVRELFVDGPVRSRSLEDLSELRQRLGGPGAGGRAAHAVRSFLCEVIGKGGA